MIRLPNFSERVTVSDEQLPDNLVEVSQLWSLAIQWNDDEPWYTIGTHIADAAAILRTYDFPAKGMEDAKLRIHRTTVTVEVADVEELRKKVEEASAEEKSAAVPLE